MRLLKKITNCWYFPWLIFGLFLRLILSPITAHSDLWGHSFTAYFFAYEGKFNIYDYLINLPQSHPLVRNFGVGDIFIYPPLTYFTLGIFRFLVKPFTDSNFIPWLMENINQAYFYPKIYSHIFFFKFPYIFLDILLAFLLSSLLEKESQKKLTFLFWMFNPIALYTTFMIGQIDILPVFFVVLSLFLIKNKKINWAMFSLGVGGSYKLFPLLLIFPTAFKLEEGIKKRIKLILIGFFPFILSIFPYLFSKGFRSMVLFSPKSQKMLFMNWALSGAESIYPFIFILIFLYFYAFYYKNSGRLIGYYISILLLIFSVTHYHPQWFLWITPFLILELVENNFKHIWLVLTLFSCWLFITLTFEASLSYGLFVPIFPHLKNASSLADFLSRWFNVFQLKSLVRSVFAGTALFYSWVILKEKNAEE
ncbi:MAG: glycosyltransferase 87 family protein [Microgenomates group bacterium]